MSDLLLTGYSGKEYRIMSYYTMPLIEKYAKQHNAEFGCMNLYDPNVPPAWMKVINIINALEKYEKVLWLDCDIVIRKFEENIFDELNDMYIQALVEHYVDVGDVPNSGVWLVNRGMLPILKYMWDTKQIYLNHLWWEQSSLLNQMGYSIIQFNSHITKKIKPSPVTDVTKFLDSKWNHHPGDSKKVDDPNFMHITMYEKRLEKIIELTKGLC
jgi:lipopolysaccharide biosynthesis glycosyltransferase